MPRGRVWTEEETAILRQMVDADSGMPALMARLGRSKHSIKERWRWISRTEENKAQRREQINLNRRIRSQFGPGATNPRGVSVRGMPEQVIADREARIGAGPRDLTGAFFGDPPRGFSALDRKLKGDDGPTYLDRRMAQLQRTPSLARGTFEAAE